MAIELHTKVVHVTAILCVAITMSAGCAHLFALPNKIGMSRDDYLVAQQIYRGWALLGIVEFAALILAVLLAWQSRPSGPAFGFATLAAACIAIGLAIFFAFTFPANQATQNWTMLPQGWEALRARWEYSHAAGALLDFAALTSLVLAALCRPR